MRKKGIAMKAVHTKSIRREIQDRVRSLPSKLRQVDTQGRRISAFQGPPLQGKALGLLVHLLLTLKTGVGVDTSWMFSHLLQLWGGDYPRIFPLLNGDKGRCARLWRTHWERGGAAHHCVSSLWSWGRRADRSGSGLVLFLMTPRGRLEGGKTRQGKLW